MVAGEPAEHPTAGPHATFREPATDFWRRAVGALGAALLYAAALPPWNLWPLAFLAIAALVMSAATAGVRRGLFVGFVFSLGLGLFATPWLPGLLAAYFGVPVLASWPFAAVTVLVAGGWAPALFGAWVGWATRQDGVSPLWIGVAFALSELARGLGALANPVIPLASAFASLPIGMQTADLLGAAGTSGLCAAVGSGVASVFVPSLRGRRPRLALASVLALAFFALGYGAMRLSHEPSGPLASLVVVQPDPSPEGRFDPLQRAAQVSDLIALSDEARKPTTDLIVWPELAFDFELARGDRERRQVADWAREWDVEVLVGALGSDGESLTNSVFFLRSGTWATRVDKARLVPGAEVQLFGLWPGNLESLVAVAPSQPLATRAGAVGVLICSEAAFGQDARRLAAAGAQILVNPSNDTWFGQSTTLVGRIAREQQLAAAALRAVETRRALVRPTLDGMSAVIDSRGRVVAVAPTGMPATLSATLHRSDALSGYVRLGDVWAWLAAGALAIDAVHRIRSRARQASSRNAR